MLGLSPYLLFFFSPARCTYTRVTRRRSRIFVEFGFFFIFMTSRALFHCHLIDIIISHTCNSLQFCADTHSGSAHSIMYLSTSEKSSKLNWSISGIFCNINYSCHLILPLCFLFSPLPNLLKKGISQ